MKLSERKSSKNWFRFSSFTAAWKELIELIWMNPKLPVLQQIMENCQKWKICFCCDCKRFINVAISVFFSFVLPRIPPPFDSNLTKSFCLQIELLKGFTIFPPVTRIDGSIFPHFKSIFPPRGCCEAKVFMINIRLALFRRHVRLQFLASFALLAKEVCVKGKKSSLNECKWHSVFCSGINCFEN